MVELKFGLRAVDVPYMIRLYGITDEMFDEMVDEDTKAELIYGTMIVYSPETLRHDDVAGFLRALMRCYASEKGLGRVFGPDGLVRIKKGIRVCPDLFFLANDCVPNPLPEEYRGVPNLTLELMSLQKSEVNYREKRPLYREAGVKEIWFVNPVLQEVIIDRLRGRYYVTVTKSSGRVESAVIKGFWIQAEWLWVDPLPNIMECLREILG